MLIHLVIKNYALIKHLEMSPVRGLNIITGETGAGKSIMLGALGLLLGNRADTKVLFDENSKCIIEGSFNISEYNLRSLFSQNELDYDEETIIRREISPSGKSRAFINDTPVNLDILKTLGIKLMDIHSQHEIMLISKASFQLNLIDAYAGLLEKSKNFKSEYSHYTQDKKKLNQLEDDRKSKLKEADYKQFLLKELHTAQLQVDEQVDIEEQLGLLENAEEIKSKLSGINEILSENEYSAVNGLNDARQILSSIKSYTKELDLSFNRLKSIIIELDDLIQELTTIDGDVEFDPEKAEILNARLSLIYQLQTKHQVSTIEDLLQIQNNLNAEVLEIDSLEEEISKLSTSIQDQEIHLTKIADELSAGRKKVVAPLQSELVSLLKKLGIPDARIVIEIKERQNEFNEFGKDQVNVLFSANVGVEPQNLASVASGGEFSRVMFSIKHVLADKIALPTIIFDEIDTGVSGEIALRMGEMMKFMATNHQIISISHLPQIAARAENHYSVYKDRDGNNTVSKVKLLTDSERIIEIAKMIGGDKPTDTAMENARELIMHN